MKNKILTIGSSGYIGTELMKVINSDGLDYAREGWHLTWDIRGYDTIILLAGHSSMPMGRDDPDGCWQNNVANFKRLLERLEDNQRLIYASSASVYNNITYKPTEECPEFYPMNMYDLSKYTIDQLAKLSGKHTYGLRFVTVNGYSDVLRVDLMLNKMVETTKKEGVVKIKNAKLHRPLLDIQDAVGGIKTIVDSKEDHRGIYNFCSLNGHTVGEYAQAVVDKFGGKVEDLGDEPAYVYGADTTKFEKTYNFKFKGTIDSILESLKKEPKEKVVREI